MAASGLSAIVAAAVLVGWQTDKRFLKTLGDQQTFMAPATAVLLLLGAFAVWLAQPAFRHWTVNVLSRMLGGVIFVWALLTCAEHAFQIDLGIDRIVYSSRLQNWTVTSTPGRFSIQAAVSLTLIGAALLLLDRKVLRVRLHEVFAGFAFIIGFLGLVGHAYGVQTLYGVMAFHSAISLSLLGAAVMLTRPSTGLVAIFFATNPAGVTLRRTLFTSSIALAVFGWVILKFQERMGLSYQASAAILVLVSVLFIGALLIRTSYALLDLEREREAARRALFESEAKYRSIFENTAEGIALYEPVLDDTGEPADWIVRDANPTFVAATGLSPVAIIGHRLTEIFGQREQFPNFLDVAREVFRSRRPRQFESFFAPLKRHYIVSCFPIDHRLFASTTVDVTKSKEAEQQIRESEARYRRIVETASEGIWMLDENMVITFVNDRCAQILGYAANEIIGKRKFDFVFEEDAPFIQALFDSRRRGQRAHLDVRMRHRDGTARWLMLAASPIIDANGKFHGALDMFTDVTDRRAAVQALRESEERFRQLADSMPQMVWTASPTGIMEYSNRRWIEYTGLTPIAQRWDWTTAVHPNDLPQVLAGWKDAVTSASEYSVEARMLRQSDAVYRWHLIRAIPILGGDGRVSIWYGTCTDIHENKLAEEAMMKSEKLAATGRLAATIAHEINNPLEAVTNLIFLAQNSAIDPSARQFLELASEELKRVAHITKQTLGFYRETASPASIDLAATLESVLALYERKFESKGIILSKRISPSVHIEAIPGEVRQVLSNLISNAIDALDHGGILQLRVRSVKGQDGCHGARIIIADNGSGIPEHLQQQVFEPFFTTKRDFGTGLGLWVTRQIIRRHGGSIRVRSCSTGSRRGTVFSAFLPAQAVVEDHESRSKFAGA